MSLFVSMCVGSQCNLMGITRDPSKCWNSSRGVDILCQSDILERAAILDAGQEGAVKVSCCFLSLPENYTLFSLGRAAQHVASGSQVEN